MAEFKMTKAELSKFSVRMLHAQLTKNVRELEIRPEAAAEILKRATDFGGKVFHEFCRLQQTLRGNRVPGAVRRSGGHALRQLFQPIRDHLFKLLFFLRGTADEFAYLLLKRFEQFLPLTNCYSNDRFANVGRGPYPFHA